MRKLAILFMLGLFVLACSTTDIAQLIPAAPTPLLSSSPTPFPTWTNTLPAPPTYTLTPTLIGQQSTPTRMVAGTFTAVATSAGGTPTMVNTVPGPAISPTVLPGDTGFDMILVSHSQLYIGACGPQEVNFEVLVNKPDKVMSVVIFMKLRDKLSGEETGWDRGTTMNFEGEGKYAYTLKSSRFTTTTDQMWVVYQMVGTDDEQNIVARSQVYANSLALLKCP